MRKLFYSGGSRGNIKNFLPLETQNLGIWRAAEAGKWVREGMVGRA